MSFSVKSGLNSNLPATGWLSENGGPRMAFSAYPAAQPWLHLLISHGLGEHRGWYHHVAEAFRAVGISSYTFDHFHHGISDGKRGDVFDYEEISSGLRLALNKGVLPLSAPSAPLALLGHSNGGLAILHALPTLPLDSISGLILCNPLLGMRSGLEFWGDLAGRLISYIAPALMITSKSDPSKLTGNKDIWEDYVDDPLRLRRLSIRFFMEMKRAMKKANMEASCQGIPLLLLIAELDFVVDSAAALDWFGRVPTKEKRLLKYQGLRHELFNETQWESILADVTGWL